MFFSAIQKPETSPESDLLSCIFSIGLSTALIASGVKKRALHTTNVYYDWVLFVVSADLANDNSFDASHDDQQIVLAQSN